MFEVQQCILSPSCTSRRGLNQLQTTAIHDRHDEQPQCQMTAIHNRLCMCLCVCLLPFCHNRLDSKTILRISTSSKLHHQFEVNIVFECEKAALTESDVLPRIINLIDGLQHLLQKITEITNGCRNPRSRA